MATTLPSAQVLYENLQLDGKKNKFRLCRFKDMKRGRPFDRANPIEMEMKTDSDDNEKYFALSYMWGPGGRSSRIGVTCNGGGYTLDVTSTMETALRELRILQAACSITGEADDAERWWWIDMLCINQGVSDLDDRKFATNIIEETKRRSEKDKETQIPLMRDIYDGRALGSTSKLNAKTVVWLGGNVPEKGQATRMRQHTNVLRAMRSAGGGAAPNAEVAAFCRDPYWMRVWIIQEVCTSEHIYFINENVSVGWASFQAYVEKLFNDFRADTNSEHLQRLHGMQTLVKMRQTFQNKPGECSLAYFASEALLRKCSVRQDMVYALMGLVKSGSAQKCTELTAPKLKRSSCQVFSIAAQQMWQDLGEHWAGNKKELQEMKDFEERVRNEVTKRQKLSSKWGDSQKGKVHNAFRKSASGSDTEGHGDKCDGLGPCLALSVYAAIAKDTWRNMNLTEYGLEV